jgi:chromosome segregation ATPase
MNDDTHTTSSYDEHKNRMRSSEVRKLKREKKALEMKLHEEEQNVIRIQGLMRGLEHTIKKKEQKIETVELNDLNRLEREVKGKKEELHKVQKKLDNLNLDLRKDRSSIENDKQEIERKKRRIAFQKNVISEMKTELQNLTRKLE